jgi:MFS family permease
MHIVSTEVAPEHRGLALGAMSTLGLNVVPLLGPLLIVGIGATYGWRHAFWVAGIPGLILALIIWRVVRNPAHEPDQSAPKGSVGPLLKLRNIRVNLILATLLMSCVIGINGFLPLYLVRVLGLSDGMMGLVMTMIAAAMVLYGFVGPMLSDRIGRKTVIIAFFLVSVPGYLMLIYSGGALPLILAGGMIGAAFTGASILIMAAIPGESAPPHLAATAMGFVAGTGEMLGAGLMPVGVGWLADQVGLGIVPWLFIVAATLVCLVTLGLTETAPGRLARTGTKPATA